MTWLLPSYFGLFMLADQQAKKGVIILAGVSDYYKEEMLLLHSEDKQ